MSRKPSPRLNRRQFLRRSAAAGSAVVAANWRSPSSFARNAAPAIITSDKMRPQIPYGVASGDVSGNAAVLWSRCNRPARAIVEYAATESFNNSQRIVGPAALEKNDFTARLNLSNLPGGQDIFYRFTFQDLADPTLYSVPAIGRLRVPPAQRRNLSFAWSGDTAGQGWGINPDWGGLKIYETIRQFDPDFFIHSGDYIYADNPLEREVRLEDGSIWKNLVTPEKSKVAETLAEFRGNYTYALLDDHLRRFNAQIPQIVQWDDHETTNNWYPGERLLADDRYQVKSVSLLAARAKQAFLEYTPVRLNASDPERIYRSLNYGPSLDIFVLDQRSYRGPNTENRQRTASSETAFLGNAQLEWLKRQLQASRATWKVIASDMPIGLIVPDGTEAFENAANGDGPPLGRELEFADLLSFIKKQDIPNVVWLTADVHYAAAHYYNPAIAQFSDFKPFWEFVAGPLHAGTYGAKALDNTFGPQVKFQSVPPTLADNRPPTEGLQFFGIVKIDGDTEAMTVALYDLEGKVLYEVTLQPEE
ncbi:MAG: alkaline phosphatase D family protein [Cyanobacteriota bacterium]|nr:alkaline phosphatase D family protein [Cyanobacteriota bacterium]